MENNIVCDICGKLFSRKSTLTRHIKTVDEKPTDFKCSLCVLSFTRNDNLSRHIGDVHLRVKNFKCSRCGKLFCQKVNLKAHYDSCKGAVNTSEEGYQWTASNH